MSFSQPIILVLSVWMCQPASPSPEEVLAEFKSAVKKKDGHRAVHQLSKESVIGYEATRMRALSYSQQELEDLPIDECIRVLSLRHFYSKKQLETERGESLLEKAIVLAQSFDDIVIDHVDQKKDIATATIKYKGRAVQNVVMVFRFQEGVWKLDLEHYQQQGKRQLETMYLKAKEEKHTKVEFAMRMLRIQYGSMVQNEIIKGPR